MKEDSAEFVHGKLVLSGNTFEKSALGTHSIWLEYLAEAEITDNRFDAPYIIKTKTVGKITEKDNYEI